MRKVRISRPAVEGLGYRDSAGIGLVIVLIVKNRMEKNLENEMDTCEYVEVYRDCICMCRVQSSRALSNKALCHLPRCTERAPRAPKHSVSRAITTVTLGVRGPK